MTDAPASATAAEQALDDLVRSLARASARATAKAGLDLDLDDPRVARWLLLIAFEGLFSPVARSAPARLLARASGASAGEVIPDRRSSKRRRGKCPLLTWDDLVAALDASHEA